MVTKLYGESKKQVEEHLERWRYELDPGGMEATVNRKVKRLVGAAVAPNHGSGGLILSNPSKVCFGSETDRIKNEYIRGTGHVGCFGDKVRESRLN